MRSPLERSAGWADYLRDYHAARPGITEAVITRSTHPDAGTPYQWVVAALPVSPGTVVDLACGSAPLQQHLPPGSGYVGLDLSEPELRAGVRVGRSALAVADVERLPLTDASVDAVTCSMAIMLFDRLDVVLDEVARVLRPGGTFATIRPAGRPFDLSDLLHVLPLAVGLGRPPQLPHRYRSRTVARLLRERGLHLARDEALRFAFPLEGPADAHLAVQALYLPDVPPVRRRRAADLLARTAGAGRSLPVSVRRTVATRVVELDARGDR